MYCERNTILLIYNDEKTFYIYTAETHFPFKNKKLKMNN